MNFIYKRLVGIKSLQNIKLIRLFSKKMDSVSKKVDSNIRMFDVAANLSDETFRGVYHGKKAHEDDFDIVINRAREYGVEKFLFAAGYIEDAKISYELSTKLEDAYITIGVHPCRANEIFKSGGTVKE